MIPEEVGDYCLAYDHSLEGQKTKLWFIIDGSGGVHLGLVKWFAKWRSYAFFPALETVFEKQCLRAIADFCEAKTNEHKSKKRAERA